MLLHNLLGSECTLLDPSPSKLDTNVTAITVDSRQVAHGTLFAALSGTQVDGRDFIPAALKAGAVAILSDQPVVDCPVPVITSDDARLALAKIAARFYGQQPDVVAAVTGTAGKTSVASFLRQIWQAAGMQAAMIGTTGVFAPGRADYGALTTPDPVRLHGLLQELAQDGISHCSMEASSHGLDQKRLDGVRLAVGGFTNLGRDHLDYHPTVEDYLAAKMRLFDSLLEAQQPAVIFADDPFSDTVIEQAKAHGLNVKTVGRAGQYLKLKRVEQHRYSQVAEIEFESRIYHITLPLAGEFQMANALVAAGMALITGADHQAVFAALAKLQGAPGRLELVGKTAKGAPAYVDYAHKPEALENVLLALKPYTTGKLILVFGCGGDRDKGKRAIMGEIAQRLADVVIVCDDNPRTEDAASIRQGILAAVPKALEIGDRKQAIEHGVSLLQEGDSLIVAGKGHEEGQIVGNEVLPFSDHKTLAKVLEN